jgi:hypothetical protein
MNAIPVSRFIPKLWPAILLTAFFFSFFKARFVLQAWRHHVWLWCGLGLAGSSLAVFALVSDQAFPQEQLYYFLRACPFVLLGLVASSSEAGLRNSLLAMTVGNAVGAGIGAVLNIGVINETGQVAGRLYHTMDPTLVDASLFGQSVLYWPSVMAAALSLGLSLAVFDLLLNRRRAVVLASASLGITVLSVVIAGFTAAVIVLLVGCGMAVMVLRPRLKPGRLIVLVLIASVAVGALYLGRDVSPTLDTVWSRLSTATPIVMGRTAIEDADTSGRWDLAQLSWTTFLQSPFIGVVTGAVPFDLLVGGHSSFVDVLALYGLAGSLGPFCLVGVALYRTLPRRSDRRGTSVTKALFVFWVMYLVSMALNPVWLTAEVDFYAFFALGLTAGMTSRTRAVPAMAAA